MATVAHFRIMDRAELKKRLDAKERFHFWNVLTKDFYHEDKNIPGSKHVPQDTLTAETVAKMVPRKDEPIVTYCGGTQCPQSKQAAEKLVALGYTNVSAYEGGIQDWAEAGLPLVKL
jgi:rhodanese-related sulfurtransferase